MCDLLIENSYTYEIQMKTGQTRYALANLQNLPGRNIKAIEFFADAEDIGQYLTKSPSGLSLSQQYLRSAYLTMVGEDGQKRILDTYPAFKLLSTSYDRKVLKFKPQKFTFDKSFVQIDTADVEDGKAIVMVIYFEDLTC